MCARFGIAIRSKTIRLGATKCLTTPRRRIAIGISFWGRRPSTIGIHIAISSGGFIGITRAASRPTCWCIRPTSPTSCAAKLFRRRAWLRVESTAGPALASPATQLANGHRSSKDAAALAARDRAMLELLYAGALRVSEMVNATLEDLKLESGYMLVRGKGDKERIVPLGNPAQDALSEHLAQGRNVLAERKVKDPHPLAKNARRVGHPSALAVTGGNSPFLL